MKTFIQNHFKLADKIAKARAAFPETEVVVVTERGSEFFEEANPPEGVTIMWYRLEQPEQPPVFEDLGLRIVRPDDIVVLENEDEDLAHEVLEEVAGAGTRCRRCYLIRGRGGEVVPRWVAPITTPWQDAALEAAGCLLKLANGASLGVSQEAEAGLKRTAAKLGITQEKLEKLLRRP